MRPREATPTWLWFTTGYATAMILTVIATQVLIAVLGARA